jgi:hypothetical protein
VQTTSENDTMWHFQKLTAQASQWIQELRTRLLNSGRSTHPCTKVLLFGTPVPKRRQPWMLIRTAFLRMDS